MFAFLSDKDFSDPRRVYLKRQTGDLVEIFNEGYADDEEENDRLRQTVADNPSQFLEIPIPDHGSITAGSRTFLRAPIGGGFFGSIGGWFKEHEPTEELGPIKSDWGEFQQRRALEDFKEFCTRNGVKITIA